MGIKLILGERLDLSSVEDGAGSVNAKGQKVVRTVTGREIAADLLVSLVFFHGHPTSDPSPASLYRPDTKHRVPQNHGSRDRRR